MKTVISKIWCYALATAISLVNAVINFLMLLEDGATLEKIIPAAAWTIAATVWSIALVRSIKPRIREAGGSQLAEPE